MGKWKPERGGTFPATVLADGFAWLTKRKRDMGPQIELADSMALDPDLAEKRLALKRLGRGERTGAWQKIG